MLAFNFLGKNLPSVKTSEAQMFVRALPVYKGPKELTRVFYATGELTAAISDESCYDSF